ncbi:phosphotransferase [Arcanobacterium hippocoleae]|uniref:Aminoglycoside phosphotransferase (APT) family kinase protein n=1 Tax=Arcanobacterium hippocoleae TaxID=149017 RepID=A0ABU1T041_9ACTO|nr:phosphotransferase [Arcanobacterium hippocoleae]MDR6938659.1 aminoglycoside phosphotransferase (APT) family kinase protein [Arcanobacterium hippocoleae]
MSNFSLHLAALAVAAIDGLRVVGIQAPISQNMDFAVTGLLDSNGQSWVVKFPRNPHAGTVLEAEASISDFLLQELRAGNLPFDVLRPAGFAKVKSGRAMVHRAPIGKSLSFDSLDISAAHDLGRALAAIHSLSPHVIERAGMPVYSAQTCRQRLLAELSDADAHAEVPAILRRRWRDMLEDGTLWNFMPRVTHGDFADENVLWSEQHISCVLGFGEAHVGDPAADFALLLADLSEENFAAVLESYQNALGKQISSEFLQRANLLSEFALLRWLMHGIRNNDFEIIEQAEDMLKTLAFDIELDPQLAPGPNWEVDLSNSQFTAEKATGASFDTDS